MPVLIAASSGTIAAGVVKGFTDEHHYQHLFLIHQGYDRPRSAILKYMDKMIGDLDRPVEFELINEGYSYGDVAKPGPEPLWPCNVYYDLKAFRWWMREGRSQYGEALLWNIG